MCTGDATILRQETRPRRRKVAHPRCMAAGAWTPVERRQNEPKNATNLRTPRSSVPQPGQPNSTYYGQPPTGIIGRDLPKEIVRVDREWSLGDICQ